MRNLKFQFSMYISLIKKKQNSTSISPSQLGPLSYSLLLLLVMLLTAVGLSCKTGTQQEEKRKAKHKEGNATTTLIGIGILEAGKTYPLFSPVEGEISWLAKEGMFVKEGELVAKLTCKEIEEEYKQTAKDLAKAKTELKNSKQNLQAVRRDADERQNQAKLNLEFANSEARNKEPNANKPKADAELHTRKKIEWARRILSNVQISNTNAIRTAQKNVQIKEYEVRRLQEELKIAQKKLDLLSLKAPTDGLVIFAKLNKNTDKHVQVGDSRWRGSEVVRIADPSDLYARIHLNESDIDNLRLNQKAKITIEEGSGGTYSGKVAEVFPHSRECEIPLKPQKSNSKNVEPKEKPRITGKASNLSQTSEAEEGIVDVLIEIEGTVQDAQLGTKVKAEITVPQTHK